MGVSVKSTVQAFGIAVVGAHGSGKTTLIRRLVEIVKHVRDDPIAVTGEVARRCPYPVGQKSNEQAQQWIMSIQDSVEYVASQSSCPVFFDRCLLDQYAYYRYWVGRSLMQEEIIRRALPRYGMILLLPPQPRFLVSDGLRPVDPRVQREIASLIEDNLNQFQLSRRVIDPSQNDDVELISAQIVQQWRQMAHAVEPIPCELDFAEISEGTRRLISALITLV